MKGLQLPGATMDISTDRWSTCAGFPDAQGSIVIHYKVPSGLQGVRERSITTMHPMSKTRAICKFSQNTPVQAPRTVVSSARPTCPTTSRDEKWPTCSASRSKLDSFSPLAHPTRRASRIRSCGTGFTTRSGSPATSNIVNFDLIKSQHVGRYLGSNVKTDRNDQAGQACPEIGSQFIFRFGYPDAQYLDRVERVLKTMGIVVQKWPRTAPSPHRTAPACFVVNLVFWQFLKCYTIQYMVHA